MGLQVKSARANKMYWHLILFAALHQDAGPIAKTCQVKSCAIYVQSALDPLTEFCRGYLHVITNHIGLREHEELAELRAAAVKEDCN